MSTECIHITLHSNPNGLASGTNKPTELKVLNCNSSCKYSITTTCIKQVLTLQCYSATIIGKRHAIRSVQIQDLQYVTYLKHNGSAGTY